MNDTQRLGQRLVNYVRFGRLGHQFDSGPLTEEQVIARAAAIERYIFNMSDEEFQEAIKEDFK